MMVATAFGSFICISILKMPFPLIIFGSAILGAAVWRASPGLLPSRIENDIAADQINRPLRPWPALFRTLAFWGANWLLPLPIMILLFGPDSTFAEMGIFFSKVAVVTFGGAYAVPTYVGQEAVDVYGWLSTDDMLTGLGLAETTLGPLVLVLVFVGFMGGANAVEANTITGGIAGGLVAAFFTFAPCFLWIFVGAPFIEKLRDVRWLQASLSAITASVVGVIANLAWWFGLAVLFGSTGDVSVGPFHLSYPAVNTVDWLVCSISLVSAVMLLYYNINMLIVLFLSAAAGILALHA